MPDPDPPEILNHNERLPQNPLLAFNDLSVETWEPTEKPNRLKQWTGGWRLLGILFLLFVAYFFWRGKSDYLRVKNWRGRSVAAQAAEKAAGGDVLAARELFKKAVILAPRDPAVLRPLVDFCEQQKDPIALFALRQLTMTGTATAADWERLCYLSQETGHPEMLPIRLLSVWAAAPEEAVSVGQLTLSCEWLVDRGRFQLAENRLRRGRLLHPENEELALALYGTLAAHPDPQNFSNHLDELIQQTTALAVKTEIPLTKRAAALGKIASRLMVRGYRPLLTEERNQQIQQAYQALAKEAGPSAGLKHTLSAASLAATAAPAEGREAVGGQVAGLVPGLPLTESHPAVHWLVEQGLYAKAIELCNNTKGGDQNQEWFTARLDALFALNDYGEAETKLLANDQPLSKVTQQFFLYRVKLSQVKDESVGPDFRAKILIAAKTSPSKDILKIGLVAEKIGERNLALALFREVLTDEATGLQARLGVVRCLDADPTRVPELVRALEAVLSVWPQLDDARNDLIYIRLLEDQASVEDKEVIAKMAQQSPWLVSYQITAALAHLKAEKPGDAIKVLPSETIPWEKTQKGWQAIYACVLAANDRKTEAQQVALRLIGAQLRPQEEALLKKYILDVP